MRIYRHYEDLAADYLNGVIAIGNFDGVHRGHREVINEAGRIARDEGRPWGVLTFEPHPRLLFQKNQAPFRLTPFHIKARHIENLGVEFLVVLHFDEALAGISADKFVADVLLGGFQANHIVSGYDFLFGHKRGGDTKFLADKGKELNFNATSVEQVLDEKNEPISSTRIRQFLIDAKPRDAARLLGRDFEIEGRVARGDKRGRTINVPTANVEVDSNSHPATGVYAVRAGLDRGADTVWHDGIANLGYRPTFEGKKCLLETHIFDFDQEIYGEHLRVALVDFIRLEQKFDGIKDLKSQITVDQKSAKDILANEIKK